MIKDAYDYPVPELNPLDARLMKTEACWVGTPQVEI